MILRNSGTKKPSDKIKELKNRTKSKDIDDDKSSAPSKSLSDHGVFFLNGEIDESSSGEAIRFILEANLDSDCHWDHITMIINSPGGYVDAGFALIDIMMGSRIPIHTVGIGMIASMGLQIFLTGQRGRRTLTPNCMIMSHQYAGAAWGKEHELISAQDEFNILTDMVIRHYQRTTGLSKEVIREKLLPPSDVWLTAKEAKALGICDHVKDVKPLHLKNKNKKRKAYTVKNKKAKTSTKSTKSTKSAVKKSTNEDKNEK